MNDPISRADLFDELNRRGVPYNAEVNMVINGMPTIEPKKAKWIPITKGQRGYSAGDFWCSECNQPNKCYGLTNYCSHCGARMKEDA